MKPHVHQDMSDPARWDAMIALYEEQAHPFTSAFAEAALGLLEISPSTRLLDIATGMGAAALAAARRGARVLAVDFAPGMIDRVRAHGLANVEARVMDGQDLQLPDNSFDVTLSIFGVVLFPDWRRGLSEMARVTRSGGTAVVATWENPNGAGINLLLWEIRTQLFADLPPPPSIGGLAELCDPGRLGAAMEEAGFERPRFEKVTRDFRLKIAALADAARLFSMIPAWTDLEADRQAAVLKEISRRAEATRVDDYMPIPSTALVVIAEKA